MKPRYQVGDVVAIEPLGGQKFVVDGEYELNGDRWYQLSNVDGTSTNLNVPVKYIASIVIPDDSSKS